MPRKKGTRRPRTQQKTSDPLPAGRQTGDGRSEEFIFYEWTDSFFTDGMIKSLQGTSNILIVAPNLAPDSDDKNVGLFVCELAEALGAYAVVNCGRYRRPVDGDPTPEELQVSYSPKPHKKEKGILELRQRLVEETGGIPVNLDSFNSASIAAYEYAEPIWLAACAIAYKSIPLAFFVCGIDDGRADELELDVAVGAGYLLRDKERVCRGDTGSAGGAFVEELIGRLNRLRDGIRVRDGVEGYSLTGDEIAGWLRSTWTDDRDDLYEPDMADGWIADDIHSVQLAIRYTGFRDSEENLKRTVGELAPAISGLSVFQSWQREKMAKKATKKPKKSKEPKKMGKPLKSGSVAKQKQPIVSPQSAEVDQTLVNNAVHFINETANEHVYKAYEEIGNYLLEKFFNNDIALASSKNPRKPASYSELCRREDLAVHPARLGLMVRVAAQEKFLAVNKLPPQMLSYTHKSELVKLPDDQQKIDLAKECVKKSLSSRQLAERVSEILKAMPPKEIPTPLKFLERKLSDPEKLFADARITELMMDERRLEKEIGSLSPEKKKKLYEGVSVMLEKSSEWARYFELLHSQLEVYFMEGE